MVGTVKKSTETMDFTWLSSIDSVAERVVTIPSHGRTLSQGGSIGGVQDAAQSEYQQ
jgi:hypothetical protein